MSALPAVHDPDVFEGLDINQGAAWLDVDGVTHQISDMLVTERLAAAGELEAMAQTIPGGAGMVARCRLHIALLAMPEPGGDETPARRLPHTRPA